MTQEEFIRRAIEAHGNKYDYSKVIYINSYTPVEIICPLHGPFWQNPSSHISRRHPNGCPVCCESSGERTIRVFLEKHKISFKAQKEFEDCKYKDTLPFDFYLPDFNICIEFQGKQHYDPQEYFGGQKTFELVQIRDQIKKEFCKKENINLIEIPYWEKDIIKILENLLLKENTNIID